MSPASENPAYDTVIVHPAEYPYDYAHVKIAISSQVPNRVGVTPNYTAQNNSQQPIAFLS